MSDLLSLRLNSSVDNFKIGEKVTSGSAISVVRGVNKQERTINVDSPATGSFQSGNSIQGLESGTISKLVGIDTISALDVSAIFGDIIPPDFSFSDYISNLDLGVDFTPDIATSALKQAAADILSGGSIDSLKDSVTNALKSNVSAITGQATRIIGGVTSQITEAVGTGITEISGAAGGLAGSLTGQGGSAVIGAVGDLTDIFATNPVFAKALENQLNKRLQDITSSIQKSVNKAVMDKLKSFDVEKILMEKLGGTANEINFLRNSIFSKLEALENKIPDFGTVNDILTDVMGPDVPDIVKNLVLDTVKGQMEDSIDALGLRASATQPLKKTVTDVLGSTDDAPNFKDSSSSTSQDVTTDPSTSVDSDLTATRENPLNPGTSGLSAPNDRHRTNIANEPVEKFEGQYPYNKAYRSESGHLIEIDDTPGHERLLNQHISGTYTEMKPDGTFVTKVQKDSITVIVGDGCVTIEGDAVVTVTGDCDLRVGGYLTITADKGINVSTKGDFRLKAKSINMESSSGDISARSAKDLLLTSVATTHSKSKKNLIESLEMTSLKTGQQFVVESDKISQFSTTDFIVQANKEVNISSGKDLSLISKEKINSASVDNYNIKTDGEILASSKGDFNVTTDSKFLSSSGSDYNIKSGGKVIATGTTMEVDATFNAKGTTNLKATGIDSGGDSHNLTVNGQGATAAATPEAAGSAAIFKPDIVENPKESKGSGITFTPNPYRFSEATDDDPQARAIAIRDALDKGITTKKEVDEQPKFILANFDPAPIKSATLQQATLTNVGTLPPDNLRLSSSFTLGELTKYATGLYDRVTPQKGLTTENIIQNLQLLCQNVLEPIKLKYPDMKINSGFRSVGRNAQITGAAKDSRHMYGIAADIGFTTLKTQRAYYEVALWIKQNVPYTRIILESALSNGVLQRWIHVEYDTRPGAKTGELTFWNHGSIKYNGLVLLDRSGSATTSA